MRPSEDWSDESPEFTVKIRLLCFHTLGFILKKKQCNSLRRERERKIQ